MIQDRWRSTRAKLNQETGTTDTTGLWSRIAASRREGQSVDLPAIDPRSPMTPMLLGVLAVAAVVALTTLRSSSTPVPIASAQDDDPEDSAILNWLPTLAQAQAVRPSALPPIDPPDVARLTPRMLVYRRNEGVDGVVTGGTGTDTLRITRDTQDGREVIALIRTGRIPRATMQAIDSLVLGSDGSFLFWRYQASRPGTGREITVTTTLLTDSVSITFSRSGGRPVPVSWPANIGDYVREPLVAMLPSLPFEEGYARSVSGLDLVRGTTTPGFARSLELRVTGTQSIRVPAGRFRCWTVELTAVYLPGDKPQVSRLWVDMDSGSLVRAAWITYNDFFEEQVLIEEQLLNQPARRN